MLQSNFSAILSFGIMTRNTSSTNSTGWICICRTCTNTQPFVLPKTCRIFASFAVAKMNLSCTRSIYLIEKKNNSCQNVSLGLHKIPPQRVGEMLVSALDASFFFVHFVYSEEIPHKSWNIPDPTAIDNLPLGHYNDYRAAGAAFCGRIG